MKKYLILGLMLAYTSVTTCGFRCGWHRFWCGVTHLDIAETGKGLGNMVAAPFVALDDACGEYPACNYCNVPNCTACSKKQEPAPVVAEQKAPVSSEKHEKNL
jgi:hypothetical protein